MLLHDESRADPAAIAALHRAAFGGPYEARLVEDLRAGGWVVASLVAIEKGDLVGHIMLGTLSLAIDGKSPKGACLAPLSIAVSHRSRGIAACSPEGTALSSIPTHSGSIVCAGIPTLRKFHEAEMAEQGGEPYLLLSTAPPANPFRRSEGE